MACSPDQRREESAVAVLISGGLDSCILLGEMLTVHSTVYPLYMRCGLSWEGEELSHLMTFLHKVEHARLRPLYVLELPVKDLYGDHWSITGRQVPDARSPDEAVFLPGRNVLLLAKAMLWCQLHGVPKVVLGILESNPFADATSSFFRSYQDVVNQALDGEVRVERPYAMLSKAEIMRRGRDLPLGLTFSCIQPIRDRHCGRCNKCAERRRAFLQAGMSDPTEYDAEQPCTA